MIRDDDIALIEPERLAAVVADEVAAEARKWTRDNKRPRALSARDALIAARFEVLLVAVAAANLANGVELTDDDRERLMLAHRRLDFVAEEALR